MLTSIRTRAPSLFTIAVTIFFGWYLLFAETPQAKIKRALNELVERGSFIGEEKLVEQLARAHDIGGYFTSDFEARVLDTVGERTVVHNRKELEQRILAARPQLAELKLSYENLSIEIKDDNAIVHLFAHALGRTPGRDDFFEEKHRIMLRFVREGRYWLIARGENLDPVEPFDN
jgi:hypothetical protein